MLIIKHTVETKASASAVWSIWQDVPNWKTWDPGIEYATLNGPFVAGAKGTLKPKEGPLVKTCLTHVEPMKMFVDESKLPLTKIIVTHTIAEANGKRLVTHQIEMKGMLAFLFAYLIGRNMKKKSSS